MYNLVSSILKASYLASRGLRGSGIAYSVCAHLKTSARLSHFEDSIQSLASYLVIFSHSSIQFIIPWIVLQRGALYCPLGNRRWPLSGIHILRLTVCRPHPSLAIRSPVYPIFDEYFSSYSFVLCFPTPVEDIPPSTHPAETDCPPCPL